MQEVDRLGWAVTVPMRAGGHVLGVRANSVEVGELLRELFADRVVDDADPPGNLSVYLAPKASDRLQELHRFYVTYGRMLRTRSIGRMLDALWHELDMRDVRAAKTAPLLDATVMVRDGKAHVWPAGKRRAVVDDERRWNKDGFALVDRRWVEIDVGAGTLRVPKSELAAPDPIGERGQTISVGDDPASSNAFGVMPIAAWAPARERSSFAERVVEAAAQLLDRPTHHGGQMVTDMSSLLKQAGT